MASFKQDEVLIHLHVMKTGGTTLQRLLKRIYGDEFCPHQVWDLLRHEDLTQWRVYSGHMGVGIADHIDRQPVFITMLRHPVEQALSLYGFWQRLSVSQPDHPASIVHRTAEQSFREWLEDPLGREQKLNGQTRALAMRYGDRDLPYSDDVLLSLATAVLDRCAVVGLTERFDESIAMMGRVLGWAETDYANAEVAPKRPQMLDLPAETVRQMMMLQRLDFALVAYAEFLFNRQYEALFGTIASPTAPATPKAMEILSQAHTGTGWYPRETAGQHYYHWTGPETTSKVRARLEAGTPYDLRVHVLHAASDAILQSLAIHLNDRPLVCRSEATVDGVVVVCDIPAADIRGEGNDIIALSVEKTRPAEEINPADTRRIGVAVSSITVSKK